MQMIKSRKHAQSRFNQQMSAALAVMLLPVAAHAADAGVDPVIVAGSNQTLQEVKVTGNAINDFKAEKASSAKYTEKLVDTAQTLTVIKKELFDQQGAVTLSEALRNTPGVGAFFLGENGSTTTGDGVYMRGFDASSSIYVDGVRDVGSISRDTFNIEQIDVLKGPAGTDNGRSSPTGSINLVSKKPLMEDAYLGSVTVGSGSQKRATADLNKVINADTGTAFRLNLLDQDSGNPARDVVNNKRWAIAPSVAFGLNGPTRVYLNYLHVSQDNIPDGGVLTIGLPGWTPPAPVVITPAKDGKPAVFGPSFDFMAGAKPVDPKNFYGSVLDFDKVKADMFTARIEHDFAGGARLQNTTRYGRTKQDYLLTAFMSTGANLRGVVAGSNPDNWQMARTNLNYKDQLNEILTNQTTVTADFDGAGMKHTVVGGIELINEKQTNYTNVNAPGATGLPLVSIYHPNTSQPVTAAQVSTVRNGARGDGTTNTQSLYVFDTAKLGDQWIFNAGVRVDHYNTTYNGVTVQGTATPQTIPVGTLLGSSLTASDNLLNGKLSALYKPTADSSVYVLAATSKAPPGGNNFTLSSAANSASNPNYDPQITTTYEMGTKWDLLKQKLSLSAAAYRTDVRNEIEVDPNNAANFFQTGKKRVQGVELGVTGEIMRNWLVSAGYTRMSTKVVSGKVVTAAGENLLSYTPKQAFTLWTSYTLPMGLQVGGGARFSDKLMRGTDGAVGTPAYADAYWVYDAMASYPINKHVDLRLNVYNLADKQYVQAINKSGYRYTPGAPRSASLTANFKF
ncbi:catecholate siderophore receptor Fiu [Duganella sp. HH105]|uniref:catecholate siderophore receptor Fiu n=1 Tax=Duganella sp. HH105 TaxID=1781067 RepID=UPI000877C07A|nr:catecholate siderophore receptor Fiu [Duganella sp. HH105]OEZ61311.1 catecholate siderophore receptor Fiu precursor [Duganella sp. HH105]